MNTPAYFGSVGIMNAAHMHRARRRPSVAGYAIASLAALFRKLANSLLRKGSPSQA